MPYYADVAGAPQNSIIGGASLWVMDGKKADEYKGIAKFLTYLRRPGAPGDVAPADGLPADHPGRLRHHQEVRLLRKEPGHRRVGRQMIDKPTTPTRKGVRFGNFVQIRDIFQEEFEDMLAGKQDAKEALDTR